MPRGRPVGRRGFEIFAALGRLLCDLARRVARLCTCGTFRIGLLGRIFLLARVSWTCAERGFPDSRQLSPSLSHEHD